MLNIVWSGTFTKPCGKSNRLENKFPSVCFLLIDLQVPYPSKVDVEMREWGLIRGQNKSNMRSQNYHHSHGTGYTFITCNRSCQPQSLNQHHRPVKDHAGHWRWWVGSVFSEEYNFIFVLPPNLRTTPPAYPVYAKNCSRNGPLHRNWGQPKCLSNELMIHTHWTLCGLRCRTSACPHHSLKPSHWAQTKQKTHLFARI